jgi:hypothetical protein
MSILPVKKFARENFRVAHAFRVLFLRLAKTILQSWQ